MKEIKIDNMYPSQWNKGKDEEVTYKLEHIIFLLNENVRRIFLSDDMTSVYVELEKESKEDLELTIKVVQTYLAYGKDKIVGQAVPDILKLTSVKEKKGWLVWKGWEENDKAN